MSSSIKWSKYQQDIFDFGVNGTTDNGIVNAVAGSGKTTTILKLANDVQGSVSLIAFNKSIAGELQKKLGNNPNAEARTCHSIGYGAINARLQGIKLSLDGAKYKQICKMWVEENMPHLNSDGKYLAWSSMANLINLARMNLVEPTDDDAIEHLMMHHALDTGEWIYGVEEVMHQGNDQVEQVGRIDYTDMIYLPNIWECPIKKSAWIMVDEAQDLSPAQLGLVRQVVIPDFGREIYVGDPSQAIYGFAGADANSFNNIKTVASAVDLPLSICYRCPISHLALVKDIVPHIEARPGAPEGIVRSIKYEDLHEDLRANDLILCRLTAPIIRLAISLIKRRVPASVKGREIGAGLISNAKKVSRMKGFTYDAFLTFMQRERESVIDFYTKKGASDSVIAGWEDKFECIEVCYQESGAKDIRGLCDYMRNLFLDKDRMIYLSTVHKAKGLENDRIFILQRDTLPLIRKKQQPWELTQEYNLKYVALTRSTNELIFVEDRKREIN